MIIRILSYLIILIYVLWMLYEYCYIHIYYLYLIVCKEKENIIRIVISKDIHFNLVSRHECYMGTFHLKIDFKFDVPYLRLVLSLQIEIILFHILNKHSWHTFLVNILSHQIPIINILKFRWFGANEFKQLICRLKLTHFSLLFFVYNYFFTNN